jgi:hypothetical protein
MSNALAIAATTATLRHLLLKPVQARVSGLHDLSVTTQPPDLARKGNGKSAQINAFLYQTVVNAAWRNMDMPRQVRPGETAAPPLALNLHYLITAYGRDDNDNDDTASSHVLLGGAMSILHDHPLLGRQEIRDALGNSDLADQFERIRITPLSMSLEEMSKLWSAFQTQYRLSMAYEVTVVLIDSNLPVKAPLPVLKRGKEDRGVTGLASVTPALKEIWPSRRQPAARLGEDVAIIGDNLQMTDTTIRFTSLIPPPPGQSPPPVEIVPQVGDAPDEIKAHIESHPQDPDALERWAPGFYTVALVVKHSDVPPIVSNEVAFALAPIVTVTPNSTTPNSVNPGDTLTVTCAPRVRDSQRVLLLFGDKQVKPKTISNPNPAAPNYKETPTTITFEVPAVGKDLYLVRLRVDGVDSIPVVYAGTPPVASFDPAQKVTVA